MIHEVRVRTSSCHDTLGAEVLQEAQRLSITSLAAVKTARVYRLEGVSEEEARRLARLLFCDPISQEFNLNAPMYTDACIVKEVAYKPGVMNPEAASIMKAAKDLGIESLLAVDSSTEYAFYSAVSNGSIASDVDVVLGQLLVNKTVERVVCAKPATLIVEGEPGPITVIQICSLDDQGLMALSNDKLFLDLTEMRAIQEYAGVIGRDLFDMELETFGVAWSQHCGHKTFKSRLVVDGVEKDPLYTRLKRTAGKYSVGVISAFVDNSGVVDFYDGYAICGKVETHNSPSALEPYGGAATGTGGVFRDVLGTGKSAKLILSTDMFCFAPPNLAPEKLPLGCLHPHYLLRRVVAGVRDYGNRMGVPTSNGSVHFHEDFRAKPTVIVGAYGIMPVEDAIKGQPKQGDLVVTIGGRTGRDGIHGATFSSGEMTDQTVAVNSSAVQIGNAIEEKRTSDAILACRKAGLIRAITDCGAGGFTSAISEMGSETGVRVYLERAPLKYSGLAPWEIWISESQERMVLAVAPENINRVIEISRVYGAETVVLGEFTADKRLVVSYNGVIACDLDMEFLYHGLPKRVLRAHWTKPVIEEKKTSLPSGYSDWIGRYCRVLAHGDVCSKEPIVRLYDHTVQGTSALQPYSGVNNDGPNDAVVLAPILGKQYGMVVSHGLNPVLTRIDPYWGAAWSAVEAIANFTAVGGHPSNVNLIDNFIWPFPDEEELGALDRAMDACVDVMDAFCVPFISGKDSLSSTYRGSDGTVIKIPRVLCVSAFGKIPDVTRTISADLKHVGSTLVLLGNLNPAAMGGSAYIETNGGQSAHIPKVQLTKAVRVMRTLQTLIQCGSVHSCHDISQGGLAATLAEMCFGGDMGASIDLQDLGAERADFIFFNEMAGCFLLEVSDERTIAILEKSPYATIVGKTLSERSIMLRRGAGAFFSVPLHILKAAWQQPMKEVF